ncbi:MAG: purine-nucleoside phosphorylase, partial [Muribaculaceae bacterium]|nr:purine-nucleoside phosphorylase [Muribaculaceae bacterium]
MEKTYLDKINETAAFIKANVEKMPDTAVILGTGLGDLVNQMNIEKEIDYKTIPNFPVSTVEGHSGKLIFGTLGGKYIMAMQGRFH